MKQYSVVYRRDRVKADALALIKLHEDYLDELYRKKKLIYYCQLADNKRIYMRIKGDSLKEIKEIIKGDPFIKCFYYEHYRINQWIEAVEENNYLRNCKKMFDYKYETI